jgi:Na+-translocating ferredoxin:NAD+ oxidoreductase RnfD subunit
VLRIGDRHIWNPTNFGVTMMLFLAPAHVASLSVQAGNNGWAVLTIWILGLMIMYRLGRFHIPLAFVAAFVPLAFLRSFVTGHPWQTEIAPLTSPMFQLYIFFMITDPKTTTRGARRQVAVAVLVAAMETILRLAFKDVHSLYHALFIVGPAANLVEIHADRQKPRSATAAQVPAMAATNNSPPEGALVETRSND